MEFTSPVIQSKHIVVEPSSYVDPQGFLFYYQDQLLRCLHPEAINWYAYLKETGAWQSLSKVYNLVPTHDTSLMLENYPDSVVVEHEKIWPVSYPVEWPTAMLRDAAVLTIDLAIELVQYKLTLQDAYPWNILFSGTKPIFVDITSIAAQDENFLWNAHEQFEAFFIRPLILSQQKKSFAARQLLYNYIDGINVEQFYHLSSIFYCIQNPSLLSSILINNFIQRRPELKNKIRNFTKQSVKKSTESVRVRFLKKLKSRIPSVKQVTYKDNWSSYYNSEGYNVNVKLKLEYITSILNTIKPNTVLDIGCNTGVFSIAAANSGAKVIAIDSSEQSVNKLYFYAKEKQLDITTLVLDIVNPTPQFGFLGKQFPGFMERISTEAVLFLGIMHHVHVNGRQSFSRMAEMLNKLATKYLVFEYVGMDDDNMEHLPEKRFINYQLETVVDALRKHFSKIEVLSSDRASRKLLLCEKI